MLWRNLCSLRWPKLKRKRVNNFNPTGSRILYTLLGTGQMNDKIQFLKTAINSEFLIEISNLNQSLKGAWSGTLAKNTTYHFLYWNGKILVN